MSDELSHINDIKRIKERRLRYLEQQQTLFGPHTPPYITIQIEDLQQELQIRSSDATGLLNPLLSQHEAAPALASGMQSTPPPEAEAQDAQADEDTASEELDELRAEFEQFAKDDWTKADAWRSWDKLIELGERILRLAPDDRYTRYVAACAYTLRGGLYHQSSNFKRAIAYNSRAIELDPNNALLYFNRSCSYYEEHDYHNALADCKQAIQLNSHETVYYHLRALIYDALGERPRATEDKRHVRADYTQLIKADPTNGQAYHKRGMIYHHSGAYAKAVEDFTKAIELEYNLESVYESRAGSYLAMGDYDHAIADYTTVLDLNPERDGAYFQRGVSLYEKIMQVHEALRELEFEKTKAELQRVIDDLKRATELNPYQAHYFYQKSVVHYQRCRVHFMNADPQNYSQALADCRKAIQLQPNRPTYHAHLGDLYHAHGRPHDAVEAYTRAIELSPKTASYHRARAFLFLYDLNDDDKALENFETVVKLNPRDGEAHYYCGLLRIRRRPGESRWLRGLTREAQRRRKEARQYLRQASELGDTDALNLLRKLNGLIWWLDL